MYQDLLEKYDYHCLCLFTIKVNFETPEWMLCASVFMYLIVLTEQMGTRDTVLPNNDVYTFRMCEGRSESHGGLISLLLKEYF